MPLKNAFSAGGAIQHDVADEDVVLGHEAGGAGRVDDDAAAAEALADVVVGVAFESQRDAGREEGAKALASAAVELEANGIRRQAGEP